MDRHISMVSGQYPSAEMKDGYYEAMISKYAMGYLGLSTGDTAIISPYSSESDLMDPIKIKITGVFEFKDPSDLYWSQGQSAYSKNLVIDSKLYEKLFLQGDAASLTANINWSFAVDYSQMQVSKSSFYRSILAEKQGSFTAATTVNTPLTGVLGKLFFKNEFAFCNPVDFTDSGYFNALALYFYGIEVDCRL